MFAGFNLVFTQVGKDVGAVTQASLITAIPGIILGIVCFIYGSLGDFVSLKKLVVVGLTTLFIGSIFGFVANFFFEANLWTVIIARVLQTAGEQVAGSSYLVVATKYLKKEHKVLFFGLYTAGYQLSASIGVFAAGMLSTIAWQYLFLIPSVTILFLPLLLKNLPDRKSTGEKIDWFGFTLFGIATAFLTLYFSYSALWMILVATILFIGFGFYISKAQNPFVTPDFFKNKSWLAAISLILIFYFPNYCMSPIFSAVATSTYGKTTAQASAYIVWAFLVAAALGVSSGLIVKKIGRKATLICAGILLAIGFIGAGLSANSGLIVLTLFACVAYGGTGLLYSPVVSTVLDTLPQDESGRGVGMNDLIMNVTASIGISLFGGFMGTQPFSGFSLIGATGSLANYSNLLLLAGIVPIIGLVVYIIFNKLIYKNESK